MLRFLPVILFVLSLNHAWAQKSQGLDLQKAKEGQAECQRIAGLRLIKDQDSLQITCGLDNFTFVSKLPAPRKAGVLRLGNFNLLHPGTDKTLFKDLGLVAGLINQEFDVMAGVELVDVVAYPKALNERLYPLIMPQGTKPNPALTRHYRIPGYLKLLEELRKLDASWSLVISPHGDAAVETNTQELTGIYFKTSRVSLDRNEHCSKQTKRASVGCYPNFYASYMGKNFASLFSRRPFMATFSTGTNKFSMLASHVVFESTQEPAAMANILQLAFGVASLPQLPTGINKQNYARFAETAVTLKLIDKLKTEGMQNIVYTGDFNIESKNPFWSHLFSMIPGYVVLIDGQTSLSEPRFVKGAESNGLSSNYDHFILSAGDVKKCRNASVVNFMTNSFSAAIRKKYLIREDSRMGPYQMKAGAEAIISKRTQEMNEVLKIYNFKVTSSGIVPDEKAMAFDLGNFRSRVFESQLEDSSFYKFYVQIMSDHLPIRLDCQF